MGQAQFHHADQFVILIDQRLVGQLLPALLFDGVEVGFAGLIECADLVLRRRSL